MVGPINFDILPAKIIGKPIVFNDHKTIGGSDFGIGSGRSPLMPIVPVKCAVKQRMETNRIFHDIPGAESVIVSSERFTDISMTTALTNHEKFRRFFNIKEEGYKTK